MSPYAAKTTVPVSRSREEIERTLNEMANEFRVVIFTTRGKTWQGREAVQRWLGEHGYECDEDDITAEKPPALVYLDDRAVRFDGTNFPTADQIHHEYVPWNKR